MVDRSKAAHSGSQVSESKDLSRDFFNLLSGRCQGRKCLGLDGFAGSSIVSRNEGEEHGNDLRLIVLSFSGYCL